MRVLAIDPGYDRCGIAILERQKAGGILLHSDCITTSASSPFPERLGVVGAGIEALIKKFKPSSLAIENLYFNTNQKTAMHVAEVRGAIIYIAASAKIPVYEYTPPQVKAAVAGWGRADKKQMMAILPKLIHINKKIQYDDEYDAIALGITNLASVRHT